MQNMIYCNTVGKDHLSCSSRGMKSVKTCFIECMLLLPSVVKLQKKRKSVLNYSTSYLKNKGKEDSSSVLLCQNSVKLLDYSAMLLITNV